MNIKIEDIEVNMKLIKNENRKEKAVAILSVGFFKIKGFRIMTSDYSNPYGDKLWVAVPAYVGRFGKYHNMFFCENKNFWKQIEEKIWEEFYRLRGNKKKNEEQDFEKINF
jgi:DNA-binding cell septation regulator SpoVG